MVTVLVVLLLISLKFDRCVWIGCHAPPSISKMINDWDGSPIQFGETVKYSCEAGYKFVAAAANEAGYVELECLEGGEFNMTGFINCDDSKLY